IYQPNEMKVHSDIDRYDLMKRVEYLSIPQNKIIRIFKGIYIAIKNFYRRPYQILNSLNFLKYGKESLSLNHLYRIIPFLDESFDIIHCHFGTIGIMGLFLKESGISGKLVTSFHGYDINCYPKTAGMDVYKNLFRKGDFFTANTSFIRNKAIALGCDEKKISILPMGIRTERFQLCEKKNKKKGDELLILTVGRLVEEKGHRYALEALAKLRGKYKNVKYIIAGDGPLKKDLENLAGNLGMSDAVVFLGLVSDEKIIDCYNSADIFLFPSIVSADGAEEGQGLVLVEAQAAGLPVVATSIGGIPETVNVDKSAYLVPEKDSDALAEKIVHLIEDPEKRMKMGEEGRCYVKEKYDITNLSKQLIGIYQKLLS
ncbi:MAG: colanic acid biosynthesis glycosyltransferase WcaL, partial [Candidatus Schekmanbacteria bacterium]